MVFQVLRVLIIRGWIDLKFYGTAHLAKNNADLEAEKHLKSLRGQEELTVFPISKQLSSLPPSYLGAGGVGRAPPANKKGCDLGG